MQEVTEQMQELKLHTMEEISIEFNKLQVIVMNYEETCGEQTQCTFEDAINKLQEVQFAIVSHAVFSPNEDFEEIQTEHLKYLLLPYYMGDVFMRLTDNRKKNLEYSKVYFSEYLKLADHYGLVSDKTRSQWKNMEENEQYEMSREEKIAQFKEDKELQLKLKNLDKIKDEDTRREAVKIQALIFIIKAITQLKSMKQEFEILAYQQSIKTDDEAREIHEKNMRMPLPKIKRVVVPKADSKLDLPHLLSHQERQALCHTCVGKTNEEIKQQKITEVWRPDISQPSVRLEELGDMYVRDMAKMEEQKKQHEEQEARRKEENDSDGEEMVEQKRLEESAWDDWKDHHEKGAGNKGNTLTD